MVKDVGVVAAGVFDGACKDRRAYGPFPEGVTHEVGVAGVVKGPRQGLSQTDALVEEA